jgi:hypothetical protein
VERWRARGKAAQRCRAGLLQICAVLQGLKISALYLVRKVARPAFLEWFARFVTGELILDAAGENFNRVSSIWSRSILV